MERTKRMFRKNNHSFRIGQQNFVHVTIPMMFQSSDRQNFCFLKGKFFLRFRSRPGVGCSSVSLARHTCLSPSEKEDPGTAHVPVNVRRERASNQSVTSAAQLGKRRRPPNDGTTEERDYLTAVALARPYQSYRKQKLS